MKTFYVTFGLGTVCGKNYLICYAPDENTLRVRLNEDLKKDLLPKWFSVYSHEERPRLRDDHDLCPLASAYEAVSVYNSGPCAVRS